ncbi:MAG TPA: hypothetical protein GX395_08160 [Clostridia bacterium]|nr:hypothetical protein [Clostridia bacterium]
MGAELEENIEIRRHGGVPATFFGRLINYFIVYLVAVKKAGEQQED